MFSSLMVSKQEAEATTIGVDFTKRKNGRNISVIDYDIEIVSRKRIGIPILTYSNDRIVADNIVTCIVASGSDGDKYSVNFLAHFDDGQIKAEAIDIEINEKE